MKKTKLVLVGLVSGLMVITGCGAAYNPSGLENAQIAEVTIEDAAVPLANSPITVLTPAAPGTVSYTGGSVVLDASNSSQGYVMIKYSGKNQKIKIQITKSSGTTYTYNLNARAAYEVFPLTDGNGTYSIKVFENVAGTKYSQAFSKDISVKLANQYLPFLYPNQYVNFTANSNTVKIGAQVTSSTTDDLKKVELIYDYAVKNITYDTTKAVNVQSGYLPNVDAVLVAKKGICFDYASVMAAMLRSQKIPCKLVVGYSGKVYHAWINVYTAETGWVDGMIYFDGKQWQMMDPTFASSGKKSESIMKYIGTASNYSAKYIY
ncbi:transglutaminase domain-containing protein [Aminipila butyrica]|uniref:Transglutaminase domain-containing protein n=1 Tax=Aminipila butyrica TaxID=433296 RepID=A0A858BTU9_9FIRM|nr:transglutaminase-like domain-containing protein [Aminipila butyrica]QIB68498.1 transglutaminase domain-containing protein [Aminipila butyrica]